MSKLLRSTVQVYYKDQYQQTIIKHIGFLTDKVYFFFLFTNFSEIWLGLEKLVRSWSAKFTTVYVISGAIFDEDADGLRDDDTDQKRLVKQDESIVL